MSKPMENHSRLQALLVALAAGAFSAGCGGTSNETTSLEVAEYVDDSEQAIVDVYTSGFLHFDGHDDYVTMGVTTTLRPAAALTVEAWIYPDSDVSGVIAGSENHSMLVRLSDGSIHFALATTTSPFSFYGSGLSAPLGEWSHVALTYNATTGIARAYVNGEGSAPVQLSGALLADASKEELRVGGRVSCETLELCGDDVVCGGGLVCCNPVLGICAPPGDDCISGGASAASTVSASHEACAHGSSFFHGAIDEVRVWSVARSEAEIQGDMAHIIASTTTGLAGYFRLDDGGGLTAADLTSSSNHGLLRNGPVWTSSPRSPLLNRPYKYYKGHAYVFFLTAKAWIDAQSDCAALGYSLMTVNNGFEEAWLKVQENAAAPGSTFWLGLNDIAVEGNFVWVSGEAPGYTNWNAGEPNNYIDTGYEGEDCAVDNWPTSSNGRDWNDVKCTNPRPYICESP